MTLFDVYPLQPLTITRGLGSRVWDDNGQPYLDMYGGHAVISIGHSHPHWVARLEDQLKKLAFYSNSVHLPLQAELAGKLGVLSGKPDYRLFLCNSGAEANENALKLASFHTGRNKILAFTKGFHGRTSLAVAVTDNPAIQAPVNATENVVFVPFNDIPALEEAFRDHTFAAVIVEGIQGIGGIHVATDAFLQKIRSLCDATDTVFVADSVQCGYGRSGQFFAHDRTGVQADLYTTAKGMGNGFPVAGLLISPKFEAKHGMLGTTFGGNPLACAAALAVLEVMENEDLMGNVQKVGNYLKSELARFPQITALRGEGLMLGFEVTPEHAEVRKKLLFEHHVFTGEAKGGVVRLLPSLALTKEDATEFLVRLEKAFHQS